MEEKSKKKDKKSKEVRPSKLKNLNNSNENSESSTNETTDSSIVKSKIDLLKGWDKSTIAGMISAVVAALTLIYTTKYNTDQNRDSERRYFANDSINTIIRNNNQKNDSLQITTMINSYKSQQNENRRIKNVDSENLNLFRQQIANLNRTLIEQKKSLDLQNQILQVQKVSNKVDLNIVLDFEPTYELNGKFNIKPIITVKNTGNATAYDLNIVHYLICINTWSLKRENSLLYHEGFGLNLNSGEEKKYTQQMYSEFPVINDSLLNVEYLKKFGKTNYIDNLIAKQDKEYSQLNKKDIDYEVKAYMLEKKYSEEYEKIETLHPFEKYKYFIALKITFKDKFSSNNSIYEIHQLLPSEALQTNRLELQKKLLPVKVKVWPFKFRYLSLLKSSFIVADYDYEMIYKAYSVGNKENSNVIVR